MYLKLFHGISFLALAFALANSANAQNDADNISVADLKKQRGVLEYAGVWDWENKNTSSISFDPNSSDKITYIYNGVPNLLPYTLKDDAKGNAVLVFAFPTGQYAQFKWTSLNSVKGKFFEKGTSETGKPFTQTTMKRVFSVTQPQAKELLVGKWKGNPGETAKHSPRLNRKDNIAKFTLEFAPDNAGLFVERGIMFADKGSLSVASGKLEKGEGVNGFRVGEWNFNMLSRNRIVFEGVVLDRVVSDEAANIKTFTPKISGGDNKSINYGDNAARNTSIGTTRLETSGGSGQEFFVYVKDNPQGSGGPERDLNNFATWSVSGLADDFPGGFNAVISPIPKDGRASASLGKVTRTAPDVMKISQSDKDSLSLAWKQGPNKVTDGSLVGWKVTVRKPALRNGSFEEPRGNKGSFAFVKSMPGWKTTDDEFEIWSSGFQGVKAYDGDQFVELNANIDGTLYQDVTGIGRGAELHYRFAHRGRNGDDTMKVTVTDLGKDNTPGTEDDTVLHTSQHTTGKDAWKVYQSARGSGVRALGNTVRFACAAVHGTGSDGPDKTEGNFLDAVQFGVDVVKHAPRLPVVTAGDSETNQADNEEHVLTKDLPNQHGAIWSARKIDFSKHFEINADIYLGTKDAGADGLALVFQNQNTRLVSDGGGLGYYKISPSLAIEFDTYQNTDLKDPAQDHVGIQFDGDIAHRNADDVVEVGDLEDGKYHHIWFSWNASTKRFDVALDGRVVFQNRKLPASFAASNQSFFGFTAATGGITNLHKVRGITHQEFNLFSLEDAQRILPGNWKANSDKTRNRRNQLRLGDSGQGFTQRQADSMIMEVDDSGIDFKVQGRVQETFSTYRISQQPGLNYFTLTARGLRRSKERVEATQTRFNLRVLDNNSIIVWRSGSRRTVLDRIR